MHFCAPRKWPRERPTADSAQSRGKPPLGGPISCPWVPVSACRWRRQPNRSDQGRALRGRLSRLLSRPVTTFFPKSRDSEIPWLSGSRGVVTTVTASRLKIRGSGKSPGDGAAPQENSRDRSSFGRDSRDKGVYTYSSRLETHIYQAVTQSVLSRLGAFFGRDKVVTSRDRSRDRAEEGVETPFPGWRGSLPDPPRAIRVHPSWYTCTLWLRGQKGGIRPLFRYRYSQSP